MKSKAARSGCRGKGGLKCLAKARLPTKYGAFTIMAFGPEYDGNEHIAIVKGDVGGKSSVQVRVHSQCLTGDVFGSLRCDCRAQLEAAMKKIGRIREGVILYMRQEGRGIGLGNKIRAYELQDNGLDTVEANLALGFPSDVRDYGAAAKIIRNLGIRSVRLVTNNPDKIAKLSRCGIKIVGRVPHEFGRTRHNRSYLATKKNKMFHMLSDV